MKRLFVVLIALGLGIAASSPAEAIGITIGDAKYLGYVDPGTPSALSDEVVYVNLILGTGLGLTRDVNLGNPQDPYEVFRSTNVFSPLPAAVLAGAGGLANYGGGTTVNTAGYYYLLVKTGNADQVWYLGGTVASVDIPTGFGSALGTSHYALFNPTSVPDGGATMMLLGGALLALGVLRRKAGI